MYVSIRDDTAMGVDYPSLGDALKDLGLNAVEIGVWHDYKVRGLGPDENLNIGTANGLAKFKKQFSDAGIQISAFLLSNDFNAEDVDAEIAWVVQVCKAADELGVPAIRIDAYMRNQDELPFDTRMEIFSSCIKRIIEATPGSTVKLGIENHGSQGNDPEFLQACIDSVSSPRLGLTVDTANLYWRGYPVSTVDAIIKRFAPNTVHTHMKNICFPEGTKDVEREMGWGYMEYCCPLQDGDIDIKGYVEALREAGYKDDLCIEDESLGRFTKEVGKQNLRRQVEFLISLL